MRRFEGGISRTRGLLGVFLGWMDGELGVRGGSRDFVDD